MANLLKSLVLFVLAIGIAYAESQDNVRLVNNQGSTAEQEGIVEVYYNGNWGQVCAEGFDQQEAEVVCSQLGNPGSTLRNGDFGIAPEPIVITNVDCAGTESSLLSCSFYDTNYCPTVIAAVDCSANLGATGSVGYEAGIVGAILVCLVGVIGVLILFAACLWRNPVCCGRAEA